MAHKIMEYDLQQGREMAWHGLTDVRVDLSLENCWLNTWDYEPKLITVDGQKTPFAVLGVTDGAQVIVDETTGETGPLMIGRPYQIKSFKPVFNVPLLQKISKAIEGFGLTLESCGTVMNRGRLFLSFALSNTVFQAAGREFKAFLNVGNSNDMSSPLWVNTSNICTVCNNTFTANLGESGLIMSVKKTQYSDFALADIGKAIATMLKGQKDFAKQLTVLSKIACDEKTAREFFAGYLGTPDAALSTRTQGTIDRLIQLFTKGAGNDGNDFSDVFQGFTDWATHESASSQGDEKAAWKNFQSSEFGTAKIAKQEVWSFLIDEKLRKSMITLGRKNLSATAKAAREEAKADAKGKK